MTERFDTIVVGGGHNGLVCATLLARSGRAVVLLEANDRIGGSAITREFADGYSVSACAHLLYQLQPTVLRELGVKPDAVQERMATIVLGSYGEHLHLSGAGVDGAGDADAAAYAEFHARMCRYAEILNAHFNRRPPRLGSGRREDRLGLMRLGYDLRRLGRADLREFLRVIAMNIHDEVCERFSNPQLRGAVCVDAVLGTHLGPRSPGTVFTNSLSHAAEWAVSATSWHGLRRKPVSMFARAHR